MAMPSMNDNGIKSTSESQDDVIHGEGDDVELSDDVMSNETGVSIDIQWVIPMRGCPG